MSSQDPHRGDPPDLPSSQAEQRQGRTQARASARSERNGMPIEGGAPRTAPVNAGRDQPAGMGLGNAARPDAAQHGSARKPATPSADTAGPSPPRNTKPDTGK